jgi:hypothetical protein
MEAMNRPPRALDVCNECHHPYLSHQTGVGECEEGDCSCVGFVWLVGYVLTSEPFHDNSLIEGLFFTREAAVAHTGYTGPWRESPNAHVQPRRHWESDELADCTSWSITECKLRM